MRIEVELEGRKRLLDTARAIDRELVKGIRDELRMGATAVRRTARGLAPRFTGNLRAGIRQRSWSKWLSSTVYVKAPHKYLVSHGRAPGKMPDLRVPAVRNTLLAYLRAKGIPVQNLYAFARALGRRGTKAALPFMQTAYMMHRARILNGVRRAVERVFETEGDAR